MTKTYGPRFLHIGNASGTAQLADYGEIGSPEDLGLDAQRHAALQSQAKDIAWKEWRDGLALYGLFLFPNGDTLMDAEAGHSLPIDDPDAMADFRQEVEERIQHRFAAALEEA